LAAWRETPFWFWLGQVEAGQELLGILANKIREGYVFDPEPVTFLRGLFGRYALDKAVAPQPPLTGWKGVEMPTAVFERKEWGGRNPARANLASTF
jgi:hypothetical protein